MEEKKPEEQQGQAPAADKPADAAVPSSEQTAPKDALGKTEDEIAEEKKANGEPEAPPEGEGTDGKPVKKPNAVKAFFKKVNVYLLIFVLIVVVAGATAIVSFLNSKKAPKAPGVASQQLSTDALKKLATSDTTVGNAAQTLTVQGNAIFSGQVLVRSDLNVAGNIQLGGALTAPSLTVSGKTNLADTQINTLQVAQTLKVQGATTLASTLDVAGVASFGAPVTAAQITASKIILTGNAQLIVPNHLSFPGASPGRTTDQSVLGSGGTANVSGSDTSGTINISTGGGTAAGCFIKMTFSVPFATQPHVMIGPIGAAAGQTQYYVVRSTTGFSLCTDNAPPAGQVFGFDYFITD